MGSKGEGKRMRSVTLSHRGRPSASTRLVPGCGSAAPDPAEPRSRGSAAGHGRRSERTEVWGGLRGTISASKLELYAGGAMKTKKTGRGRYGVNRSGDRRAGA